jgi:hypothetical protein
MVIRIAWDGVYVAETCTWSGEVSVFEALYL